MYRFAPNIYKMLDTLSLEMKEELLEHSQLRQYEVERLAAQVAPAQ